MRTGTISNLIEYFFQEEQYSFEIEKALKEFFKLKNIGELSEKVPDFLDVNSAPHRYFHEWFVYEFKLTSGRTPLGEWYDLNPFKISSSELAVYADLQVNYFGFYEVVSSVPGKVEVENISSGDSFKVREYKAAPFLKPKEVIIARVALVKGRYEFVSGLVETTDVAFSDRVKKIFSKNRERVSLKEVYHMYHAHNDKEGSSVDMSNDNDPDLFNKPILSITEARRNLHQAMVICDILPFVSAKKVEGWISRGDIKVKEVFGPATILLGLAGDGSSEEDTKFLIDSIMTLSNAIRKEQNSDIDDELIDNKPRFIQDTIEIFAWRDNYLSGIKNMQKGLFSRALKEFDQVFKDLLDNRTTTREVYRMFANKGTVMLAVDPISLSGRYFLELALKLNPNYDFARKQLKWRDKIFTSFDKNRSGNDKEMKNLGLIARIAEQVVVKNKNSAKTLNLQNDPAQLYYEWLKTLDICFSKHSAIPTKESIIKKS